MQYPETDVIFYPCSSVGSKQFVDNRFWMFSEFQIRYIERLPFTQGFKYFVVPNFFEIQSQSRKRCRTKGPIVLSFMTSRGIVAVRVGARKVLEKIESSH